jgi:acyl-CoA synthetase (AMP-forming)/AMP-acid ligase II
MDTGAQLDARGAPGRLGQGVREPSGRDPTATGGRRQRGAGLTYAALDGHANALALALAAAGVRRGDRVAIYLENSVEAVVALFAALKAGAVFVVINPTTKADKLAYIVEDCQAAALISLDRKIGGVTARLAALPGPPKGVMATHLNVVAAARSITTYLNNTEDDVILDVLPLSFDYGLYQVLTAFKVGATVVLERSFAYPSAILDRIVQERVTGLPIVPTMSAILLQLDLSGWDLGSRRHITNTAAALPAEHIRRLRARVPGVAIYSMYGLTECKRALYLPPGELDRRPASVGRAIPNTEVWIVDEHDRRLGPGAVGELVVRGSHVTKGYWRCPEETEARFRPGPLPGERVLYTDEAIRTVVPDYGPGDRCKIVLADLVAARRYPVYSVVVRSPAGVERRQRLSAEANLGVVAATSFKQRTRTMVEYYHADRLHFAVVGTPNRLEYDQGFFVKHGDGVADVKPIAHLYKSQVYALARHLGIPEEIQRRPPTTDTYSLEQAQNEFYFALPLDRMDLALYARNHGLPPAVAAPALGTRSSTGSGHASGRGTAWSATATATT